MLDTILVNPPISSPLHPQLNLPLLKSYLQNHGYRVKMHDTNIDFFHYFLKENFKLKLEECLKNPISILGFYSDVEKKLWERSKEYEGLHVGLRSLAMKYDRVYFESVKMALEDDKSNPFIEFYENFILNSVAGKGIKILGIAITFQDQLIPAFTLANLARKLLPEVKIVFGGQMITRCQDTLIKSEALKSLYDYLVLWDGEKGMLDIHRHVINGEAVAFVNVLCNDNSPQKIERTSNAPESNEIPSPDFSDIDFDAYLYPDILVPFQTTRGCYAKCAFCAIPYGANGYKVRKVDRIIDDMVKIQNDITEKYGRKATYFKFMEDTSSPTILHDLSVEIERRGLDLKWETFARLEKAFANPGMMAQLYRGGCRKIHWGLESNDPAILSSMRKKTSMSYTDEVLKLSGEAGILNFCFVLVGFPGETDEMRTSMAKYIIGNEHIHTLTLATFDLTRGSPMEREFVKDNIYKLDMVPAQDFQVRLPYLVNNQNWKKEVISKAHHLMIEIIKGRPDIGFMTLFPDQIRALFCEEFGNDWGRVFVERYGKEGVSEMLLNTEEYAKAYEDNKEISPEKLPEPLRREHFRSKEDLTLIARAMNMRKDYEQRRFNQV